MACKKPGPAKGSATAKASGAKGGKSRPSMKQGASKTRSRHGVPKGKPARAPSPAKSAAAKRGYRNRSC